MGLWNSMRKIKGWLTLFVLILAWVPSESSAGGTMAFVRQGYQRLINAFEDASNQDVAGLLSKWPAYVFETTMFSNQDHLAAIGALQEIYYREIAEHEKIIKKENTDRKMHSSDWLTGVINHFGRSYVKEHREAIFDNIQLLFQKRHELYYRKSGERLIYLEAELYGVYRDYFRRWLDYCQSLGKDDQTRLESRKEAVGAFMQLLNDHSVKRILIPASTPHRMLVDTRARRTNEELYLYLSDHIDLRYFDAMKAVKEVQDIVYGGYIK